MTLLALRYLIVTADTQDRAKAKGHSNSNYGGHQHLGRLNIMASFCCLPNTLKMARSLNAGNKDHVVVTRVK
jgi:hypothetical protein